MTKRTIIKRVKAMLMREFKAYQVHQKEMRGTCMSSCEDLQRWHAANGILQDVLRLLGARIPPEVRGIKKARARRLDPKLEPIPVGVVPGSEGR